MSFVPKATGLCLILLFILNPLIAQSQPSRPTNMQEWYVHVGEMAKKYKVNKYLCLALAETESSVEGKRIRFGQISKSYFGPFGIKICFYNPRNNTCEGKKWNIADWRINTEVGVRALAFHIRKQGSVPGALRKYNTGDKGAKFERYVKNIMKLKAKYQQELENVVAANRQ